MTSIDTTTYNTLVAVVIGLAIGASAGCSTEPERVDADYGNSVRQMVQASTYDPEAAASTESIPVMGLDGKRAMRSLDALQTDTERVKDFEKIIDVQLGNN